MLESDAAVSVADRIIERVEEKFEGEKGQLGENAKSRFYEILERDSGHSDDYTHRKWIL